MKNSRRAMGYRLLVAATLLVPGRSSRGAEFVTDGEHKGELTLDVHFHYPPQTASLDAFKAQMARTQHLLCDATDTQVKLKKVRVSVGGSTEAVGDVWLLPQTGRSYSSRGGAFPGREGHVTMFADGLSDRRGFPVYQGTVIAHELGHDLFGLGDSYGEQWRSGACGIGPSFDSSHHEVMAKSDTWNSIMQSHSMNCRYFGSDASSRGKQPSDFNPEFPDYSCLEDADCDKVTCIGGPGCPPDAGSGKWKCEGGAGKTTAFASEFSVGNNNDCTRTGAPDLDMCSVHSEVRASCPVPRPGQFLRIVANVNPKDPTANPGPGEPGILCGNGKKDLGEQCDMGTKNSFSNKLDKLRFAAEDSGADNAPVTCGDFGVPSSNWVFCNPNCTFGKFLCGVSSTTTCGDTAGHIEACQSGYGLAAEQTCESLGQRGSQIPHCGNGLRDPGEECDLGPPSGGNSRISGKRFSAEADGANNGAAPCSDFGLSGSFAACSSNCAISPQFCSAPSGVACAAVAGKPRACVVGSGGKPALPSGTSCTSLGLPDGSLSCDQNCVIDTTSCGAMRCGANCSLDATLCSGAASDISPDVSTIEKARASSAAFAGPYELLDSTGIVSKAGGEFTGGVHRIYLAFNHVSQDQWVLNLLGRAEEFTDRNADDELTVLGGVLLRFSGSTLISVGGTAPGDHPKLTIGDGPRFLNNAPKVELELALDIEQAKRRGMDDALTNPTLGSGFRHGTDFLASAPGPSGQQQVGICTTQYGSCKGRGADYCAASWNETTGRFEATDQTMDQICSDGVSPSKVESDWDFMARNLSINFGLATVAPTDLPNPTSPDLASCGGPIDFEIPDDFTNPSDAVVVVLDRSDSMKTAVDANKTYGKGNAESRLAFAKASARAVISSLVDKGVQVGIVTFSTTVTTEQDVAKIVGTSPAMGEVDDDVVLAKVEAIEHGGRTAIGAALARAGELLEPVTAMGKTVLLLSDGENNEGPDPKDEARKLRDKGVRIFTVPVGNSSDHKLATEIADIGRGQVLDAPTGDEAPIAFVEAMVAARGEALTLARRSSAVIKLRFCGSDNEFPCNGTNGEATQISGIGCVCVDRANPPAFFTKEDHESFTFKVEQGASRLNLFLSGRNRSIATWKPQFTVADPSGQIRAAWNMPDTFKTDPFFRMIQLPAPAAGTWTLTVQATDDTVQSSYVMASVENPDPDCYAEAKAIVVEGQPFVEITANAYFRGVPVAMGAHFDGLIKKPDGFSTLVSFDQGDPMRGARALVPIDQLNGRGVYQTKITCRVNPGAEVTPGEGNQLEVPPNVLTVEPFERTSVTSFFFDTRVQPPLPLGGDCDRNGIPDSDEAKGDTDGDGLPDVCDDDDDNDDQPDFSDPAPKNGLCTVAGCPSAVPGSPQILECTGNDAATAILDGSGSFNPNGEPLSYLWTSSAPVLSASTAITSGVFPLGTTAATLTVTSNLGGDRAATAVSVFDTTGPVVTPPLDVLTDSEKPALGTATATDACGGTVSIVNDAPAAFPVGTTIVRWYGIDRFGNVRFADQQVVRKEVIAGDALFVVEKVPLASADAVLAARLEHLGYRVKSVDDDGVRASDANGAAVIVVSESSRSIAVAGAFLTVKVPVVSMEPLIWDNLGMTGGVWQTDVGDVPGGRLVDIADPGHPLAAGLSGQVTVATGSSKLEWGHPVGQFVAPITVSGDATKAVVFGFESGKMMRNIVAPARRVGFLAGDPTAATFTSAGGALFDAAITWATRRAEGVLVVNARPLPAADEALRLRLERMRYGVHVRTGSEVQDSHLRGKRIGVISESTTSATLDGRLRPSRTPILCMEPAAFDDLGMTGDRWQIDEGDAPSQTQIDILLPSHPMAAGLSGRVTVTTSPQKFVWGAPGPAAARVAGILGHSSQVSVFGYAAGTSMPGCAAPAVRTGWLAGHPAAGALSADGWKLFDAAIVWTAGGSL